MRTYHAYATGYYPDNSKMEGGFYDRGGKDAHRKTWKAHRLCTLQDFLEGNAHYVSVAMDRELKIPYWTKVRIPEIEKKYGRSILFQVVDTGDHFTGKGY